MWAFQRSAVCSLRVVEAEPRQAEAEPRQLKVLKDVGAASAGRSASEDESSPDFEWEDMNARPPLPRSQASAAASLKPALPRRVNTFTMEAQINLGAMPMERLRELSVAVQRELQVRHA